MRNLLIHPRDMQSLSFLIIYFFALLTVGFCSSVSWDISSPVRKGSAFSASQLLTWPMGQPLSLVSSCVRESLGVSLFFWKIAASG
jgi:hypothetical protein